VRKRAEVKETYHKTIEIDKRIDKILHQDPNGPHFNVDEGEDE